MRVFILVLAAACLFGAAGSMAAQETSGSTWPQITDTATDGPRRFVTEHVASLRGVQVAYRVTVAETILADGQGKPATSVFNIAYTATGGMAAQRPVLFVFNGGPGGASNTLNLAALGPKRMASFTPAAQADPATKLIDNPASVLDVADLVFIDPPETGYGRPLPGTDEKTFRSIDGDSFAVGQFILHWLRANDRMASPKYLVGESYGGHRAVALARDLAAANPKIEIDGLVLISQALRYNGPSESGEIRHLQDPLRGMARLLDAATLAWYHGKIDNKKQTLAQAIDKARRFALGPYATAMLSGNRLDDAARTKLAAQLSPLVGFTPQYLLDHGLLLGDLRRDLLRAEGKVLDQFDGRETIDARKDVEDRNRDWDAAFLGLTENTIAYGERELGVNGLERYRTVVPDPYGFEDTWQYLKAPAAGLDLVLAERMKAQPNLRLLVPLGLFDTTASVGRAEQLFAQLGAPPSRVTLAYYPGGHMVYSDLEGARQFNDDVRAFVTGKPIVNSALSKITPPR